MKKTLACILSLLMMLTMLPTVAFALEATGAGNAEALSAALAAGGSVKLTADINCGNFTGNKFEVPSAKEVMLDLNGFTLSGTDNEAGNAVLIRNEGTLTVKDTSKAQAGKLVLSSTYDDGWSYYSSVISNQGGTLTITSGTIQHKGGTSMAYAVDNLSGSRSAGLTINGGVLISETYIAIRAFANSVSVQNTIAINGGTIHGYKRGVWIQQPSNKNNLCALGISGGAIEADTQAAVQVDMMGSDGVDITVSGGRLINHSDTHATIAIMPEGSTTGGAAVTITGGSFYNSGTAGNIVNYIENDTATEILVSSGRFSAPVPEEYLAAENTVARGADTEVKAGIDPTFMIIIPTAVDFGTLAKNDGTKTKDFNVTASGVLIEDGAQIQVSVESAFVMKDKDGTGNIELAYVLNNAQSQVSTSAVFTNFVENRTEEGTVTVDTATITKAGSYKGTMVFGISYAENLT